MHTLSFFLFFLFGIHFLKQGPQESLSVWTKQAMTPSLLFKNLRAYLMDLRTLLLALCVQESLLARLKGLYRMPGIQPG